jgi:hypothetical protein
MKDEKYSKRNGTRRKKGNVKVVGESKAFHFQHDPFLLSLHLTSI